MNAMTFGLILLAVLPCATFDEKSADDLNVNRQNGYQNGQMAAIVQFASARPDRDPRDEASTPMVLKLSDASAIWGSSVVWGSSVIWGPSVAWADPLSSGGEGTSVLREK